MSGTCVHTFRTCRDAVQLLADTIGGASIYRSCPLERQLRDLTTLSQHVIAQLRFLEIVGGLWIDGDAHHPLLVKKVL